MFSAIVGLPQVSGDDLKVLSFLGQKHFLILRDAHISGDGINSLKLLKNLGGLDLKGTKFTDSEVKELIEEEGTPDLKLRVFVSGGGCSGFQYGFTFEETINEDDTKVEKDNVILLVDPMSLQYLTGAEIDYQDNVQGSQFVIKNPNATTTCGCGSSFSA